MAELPHNLEMERALLGAILFDNMALLDAGDLRREDFYDDNHGLIFNAAVRLISRGQVADRVSVREFLSAFADIVPALQRCSLADDGLGEPVETYVAQIKSLAVRRELIRAGQETARTALKPPDDAETAQLIHDAERRLQAIHTGGRKWVSVQEAGETIVEALYNPQPRGVRTGLAKLDRLTGGGLFPSDLVIIAGRPAMGKTALADNLALNAAAAGLVVGDFSMEMPAEQIAARALSRRSADSMRPFSYSSLRSGHNRPTPEFAEALNRALPETLLIDQNTSRTVAAIEASARSMKRHMGALDLILIDYLQLMRDPAKREGRVQELSAITADLKQLAMRLECPVVALSQLSRAVEQRQDKRPLLSDLRESGSIEQDADTVLFVYREHYYLERSEPTPQEGESKADLAKKMLLHQQRLAASAHEFEIYTGKQRHGPGGSEKFFCDLSMDVIADEPPSAAPTPHVRHWGED